MEKKLPSTEESNTTNDNQNENWSQRYITHAPTAVFITDENRLCLEVNPAACAITEYTEAELLKMQISSLIAPEYQEQAAEHFRMMAMTGKTNCEVAFLRKNGTRGFWSVDAVKISPTRFMCFTHDITARKQAEQALLKSEEKFRKAFMTSPDAVTITRLRDGMFISVNDGFKKILDYTDEEVVGISSLKLNIYQNQKDRENVVEELRIKGYINNYEAPFVTKSGAIVYGLMSASIIELETELYILSITRDISARKLAEASLIESESRLRAITDSAQDAILMMDSTGAICFWNQSAERILGYAHKEAMGKKLHMLLAPQRYHEAHQAAFPEFLSSGKGPAIGKTLNLHALRKDGKEIAIELSLSAIRIKNEWQALGIIRDINDRIKRDEEIKTKTLELERFNNLMIGRELKMMELKNEVNQLLVKSGSKPKYKVVGND
ncbi:MAG: PAS domain S-box protein [Bacteroidota bacterium]